MPSFPFRAVLAAVLLAGLPLSVCSVATAQHALGKTDVAPRSIAAIRFRFIADGPVRGGFGVAGTNLLFGTEAGTIYAIDARTGALRWKRALGSPVLSTPAIAGNRAYVTTWDNRLRAIDPASGRELWRRDLGRTAGATDYWEYYVSSPIVAGGRLYVGGASGRLFALDATSGHTIWTGDAGARIRTTPLVTPGAVIVGTMAGHVLAFDRGSGRHLWDFATDGAAHDFAFKNNDTRSVVTEPILAGNTVIAGGRDGNVYGIDLATGARRWMETHDGGSWILGLASDGRRFYSSSGSAFVVQAADPATGKEQWRTPTGNAMFGGIALAGGVLVSNGANASNGNLYAFDATTGVQLWRFRLPDMALSSPLVTRDAVYTGADDGSIYAVETSAAAPRPIDRFVYSFTNQPAAGFIWFNPAVVTNIVASFVGAGYSPLGTDSLSRALAAPSGEDGRKLVVIADTRLPDDVDGKRLRRFVDEGGVLVLVGPDPTGFSFDSTGALAGIDNPGALGIGPPDKERDNGNNVSAFNDTAHRLGLSGHFVTAGWASPTDVSRVLATDRQGMATAWIKRFGNGGMLIELPLPRSRSIELSAYINAIELIAAQVPSASP
jgi:eukaryotic-like serine/threonine-protein kinase